MAKRWHIKTMTVGLIASVAVFVLENHVIWMWGKYGHTGNWTPGLRNALHGVLPHYTTCPYNPLSCFQGYQSSGFTPLQHTPSLIYPIVDVSVHQFGVSHDLLPYLSGNSALLWNSLDRSTVCPPCWKITWYECGENMDTLGIELQASRMHYTVCSPATPHALTIHFHVSRATNHQDLPPFNTLWVNSVLSND